ncbi:cytochrome P450 [Haematococcus lacustris]
MKTAQKTALMKTAQPRRFALNRSTRASVRASRGEPTRLQHATLSPGSSDVRLELWHSLIAMTTAKLSQIVGSAAEAGAGITARARRLVEPPPAGFPPGPSGDQVAALLTDPLAFITAATAQFGPVVGLLLGGERVVLVADPGCAKQVLVEKAEVFVKKGTAFFPGSSLAGNGLLVSDGEVWRRQRRLANPAFRRSAVEAYAAAMQGATAAMLRNQWAEGGVRDVYLDFNQLTLCITLEALFGLAPTSTAQSAFDPDQPHQAEAQPQLGSAGGSTPPDTELVVAAVAKAFEFFTKRAGAGLLLPEWLPTWDNLEYGAAVAQLDKVVYGLIGQRRALTRTVSSPAGAAGGRAAGVAADGAAGLGTPSGHGAVPGALPQDLLQSLLMAADEDGSGMSDTALRDELMTLLVAGQETSAILLAWAAALLAHNPDQQAAARGEVDSLLAGRAVAAADTRRLPLVEAVVLEALRLYSPAYLVGRCASEGVQLGGCWSLEAGTTVLVSPYLMHRDPAVWGQDALDFRPGRWSEWQHGAGSGGYMALLSGLGPNNSYLPFGGGPRNCVGTGFAMMEAILVIASLLQRYELAPVTRDAPFPLPKPLITLRPSSVQLRLKARQHHASE